MRAGRELERFGGTHLLAFPSLDSLHLNNFPLVLTGYLENVGLLRLTLLDITKTHLFESTAGVIPFLLRITSTSLVSLRITARSSPESLSTSQLRPSPSPPSHETAHYALSAPPDPNDYLSQLASILPSLPSLHSLSLGSPTDPSSSPTPLVCSSFWTNLPPSLEELSLDCKLPEDSQAVRTYLRAGKQRLRKLVVREMPVLVRAFKAGRGRG